MIRSFSLVRSEGFSPRTNDLTQQPAVTDHRKQKKKKEKEKRHPGCLAHVRSERHVYSVAANRHQLNLYILWGGGAEHTGLLPGNISYIYISYRAYRAHRSYRSYRCTAQESIITMKRESTTSVGRPCVWKYPIPHCLIDLSSHVSS